ncbi:aminodeoxychorismate lyase [Oceanisphaera pacifica]|uniref:Aminodeoxychorismate lyase n=1 Tax=Oceanisphaera pacifica TaxID=2818389 RepID=A0ABS3NDY7_9GAMM|nr:aminodeoxychorismate lyase [Oceanisphaera pacifica]MBO1518799.1 aminodeoxychorismate lyase [Oceanisphaera pacifica]
MHIFITDSTGAYKKATDAESLASVSRGWQLGDAHFSTLHACQGRLINWSYHVARLQQACQRLHMSMPNADKLRALAEAMIDAQSDRVLRITLVRGIGGRGYSIAGCGAPALVLNCAPFPAHYYQWRQQGVSLGICQGRLGNSPLLAGLKTVNRLEQVLLKAELDAQQWPEALVLDATDNVIEAVTANVFWREGERIFTPDLTNAGVCGTLRAWCQHYLGSRLTVTHSPLKRLLAADEVWLTNALMGIVPVTAIGAQKISSSTIITQELQQAYEHTH